MTLTDVLSTAWNNPFRTKGDFARMNADLVAMAASDGFITTRIATGLYGKSWQITPRGLQHLHRLRGEASA
ncbi:MAG: hypothetical protein J0I48_10575 [Devosia sp.]|uniref:hypothetical protein n=1 Tax=Devosia sp. 66-22 TaxID=1895753 RepID=UPI00092CA012|nr:hypothetical protein [Devosia sp. 66-22]MBN9346625.1 hypothetical protein [Devosia sp.]OJX54717.1 MAG: hypothetical protein BGO81_16490 [Devosia sp. 66-22]